MRWKSRFNRQSIRRYKLSEGLIPGLFLVANLRHSGGMLMRVRVVSANSSGFQSNQNWLGLREFRNRSTSSDYLDPPFLSFRELSGSSWGRKC